MAGFGNGGKKFTTKSDDVADKKAGIKEGTKKDMALDKKRGVPEEAFKCGGMVKKAKGGSIPPATVAKIAMLSNMAGKRSAGAPPIRPAMGAPKMAPTGAPMPMMKRGGKVKK